MQFVKVFPNMHQHVKRIPALVSNLKGKLKSKPSIKAFSIEFNNKHFEESVTNMLPPWRKIENISYFFLYFSSWYQPQLVSRRAFNL